MKIVGLKVENIKGIKAVSISPDSPVVVLSGDNGAGKSSILDSIAYAIGGKRLIPDDPIRKGEDAAEITVNLDDLIVTRKFKRKKDGSYTTTLKVTASSGASYMNGQEVLDGLLGKLSFDPFAFSQMKEKDQADLLMGMVDLGIDLSEWQTEYDNLYQRRRDEKREQGRRESVLAEKVSYPDAPIVEVSVSELTAELRKAHEEHHAHAELDRELDAATTRVEELKEKGEATLLAKERIKREIAELNEKLNDANHELLVIGQAIDGAFDLVTALEGRVAESEEGLPDFDAIQARLASAEGINKQVRANAERVEAANAVTECSGRVEVLEERLEAHRQIKDHAIRNADYPVEGLEFAEDSLNYNDIPLAQASSGEQIMVSTKIGMALNPDLRILLIRNGSLIGPENWKVITDLAEGNHYQIWVEVVDTTGEVGIYIEDGEVATDEN